MNKDETNTNARSFVSDLNLRRSTSDLKRRGFRRRLAQKGNVAAGAGEIGELIDSPIAVGSAVSLTSATAANVTSITLTPGSWLVHGHVNLSAGSATRTAASAGISTTTATLPTDGSEVTSGIQTTTTTHKDGITLQPKQVLVAAGTTQVVYLVASATFSAGTVAAYGQISAIRAF